MTTKRGYWKLVITNIEPDESDLEHIARLINEGYIEGEVVHEVEEENEEESDDDTSEDDVWCCDCGEFIPENDFMEECPEHPGNYLCADCAKEQNEH